MTHICRNILGSKKVIELFAGWLGYTAETLRYAPVNLWYTTRTSDTLLVPLVTLLGRLGKLLGPTGTHPGILSYTHGTLRNTHGILRYTLGPSDTFRGPMDTLLDRAGR